MRVSGMRGSGLGQSGELGAQRQVLQVRVVAAAPVHHQRAVLQADGREGGAGRGARVLGVEGQRVPSTEHQGDALADRHGLEQLHHVGVRGAEHADVVNVDDDVPWVEERRAALLTLASAAQRKPAALRKSQRITDGRFQNKMQKNTEEAPESLQRAAERHTTI